MSFKDTFMFKKYKYEFAEPNKCIYRNLNGHCTRTSLNGSLCPETLMYSSDNSNNVLCDLAGYKEKEYIK